MDDHMMHHSTISSHRSADTFKTVMQWRSLVCSSTAAVYRSRFTIQCQFYCIYFIKHDKTILSIIVLTDKGRQYFMSASVKKTEDISKLTEKK